MASSLEDYKETVIEMRNNLICAICENPARPGKRKWYRCMELHQICQDCKGNNHQNEKCTCGEPISKEYCKQTEKLFSFKGLKFKCVNTKNGCLESFAESALEDHETDCLYRFVPCLRPNFACQHATLCKGKVTFQNVIQHYEKEHYQNKELKSADLFKINDIKIHQMDIAGKDCYTHPTKFVLNNQTFLFTDKTSGKMFYYWVYILGSPNEAKHFSYTLKLFGHSTKISYEGKVAAIDESFETLKGSGKCLAIPHDIFIAYFLDKDCDEKNRKYEYLLEIRNLKEEAKDENYESGISDDEDTKK